MSAYVKYYTFFFKQHPWNPLCVGVFWAFRVPLPVLCSPDFIQVCWLAGRCENSILNLLIFTISCLVASFDWSSAVTNYPLHIFFLMLWEAANKILSSSGFLTDVFQYFKSSVFQSRGASFKPANQQRDYLGTDRLDKWLLFASICVLICSVCFFFATGISFCILTVFLCQSSHHSYYSLNFVFFPSSLI